MRQKSGFTIGKVRTALYTSAKALGDVNAVVRGTITERLARRSVGWGMAQAISALFRMFKK